MSGLTDWGLSATLFVCTLFAHIHTYALTPWLQLSSPGIPPFLYPRTFIHAVCAAWYVLSRGISQSSHVAEASRHLSWGKPFPPYPWPAVRLV